MREWTLGMIAALALAGAAHADDKSDIQARDDVFSAAANRGDTAAIAALYAPDAVVLPPGSAPLSGPAIKGLFDFMTKGVTNLRLTATDVARLSPDYIREIGAVTYDTRGDKPASVSGTYVVVWKRVGSDWMLWTDIFH